MVSHGVNDGRKKFVIVKPRDKAFEILVGAQCVAVLDSFFSYVMIFHGKSLDCSTDLKSFQCCNES